MNVDAFHGYAIHHTIKLSETSSGSKAQNTAEWALHWKCDVILVGSRDIDSRTASNDALRVGSSQSATTLPLRQSDNV